MKRVLLAFFVLGVFVAAAVRAQVPTAVQIAIVKAEDARQLDGEIAKLLSDPREQVRARAALAAGRIGDERAVPALAELLANDRSVQVRSMAAFALGEIESALGADAVFKALTDAATAEPVRARAVEAAGKIAAANAKQPKAKELGKAILDTLEAQGARGAGQHRETVLLAVTAALRARPEGADAIVARFLTSPDARVRADAANTLARIRAKNANEVLRSMLAGDADPVARANAARALGAAEDKGAVDLLIRAATQDSDERVRVSAIRSLAALKDAKAAEPLLGHGEKLLAAMKPAGPGRPSTQSEFIEVAVALGRLLENTRNERAIDLMRRFGEIDKGRTAEVYIARFRIAPGRGDDKNTDLTNWRQYSTLAQLIGEFAAVEPTTEEAKKMKAEAPDILRPLAVAYAGELSAQERKTIMAAPDVLRAFAKFKTEDLTEILLQHLKSDDVFVRATAAELLAEQPASHANIRALETAFEKALTTDKHDNDAQMAMLDAMAKIDKAAAVDTIYAALEAPDYLIRKKAFELLNDPELIKKYPGATAVAENARAQNRHLVWPYDAKSGTKLGQRLSTDADYRRAIARSNGKTRAVVTTQKGTFTIELLPDDAPLTVDNFVKLARAGYFNGLEVHRVVPNFVMQDGDPRGDGNGGPGWSIRCEINMVPYERGAVGMALSGKDTGGSQWFVTHSPQPHLDGGYTVFGKVNEAGMKVVDNIVRGDRITSIRIVEAR